MTKEIEKLDVLNKDHPEKKYKLCVNLTGPIRPGPKILGISPYSVQMREKMDQNNSKYGYFSRSVKLMSVPLIKLDFTKKYIWFNNKIFKTK